MKRIIVTAIAVFMLLMAGCAPAANDQEELTPVTICLDWIPNPNHAGLYAAQALGYFEEEGIDAEIVQPGDNYALQLVAANQAQIGVSYQEEVTFARQSGIPVVSIAAVIQHNTSCFAAPTANGIKTIADFEGCTYGGWSGQVETALLKYIEQEYDFSRPVEIIDLGSSDFFAATESKQVDFSWIYYATTGVEAQLRDVDLDIIWVKDIAPEMDYYTPVLTAEEGWLAENGDIARKVLAAVSRGYEYADSHPAETAQILLDAVPELDEELINAGMEWMAGKYKDDAPYWGRQDQAIWQGFGDWLYENGCLEAPFESSNAFTNEYLPQ